MAFIQVDISGEVTSLKFTCYMFNIHAPFKFCGFHGLKIVHSVLCRKVVNSLTEGKLYFKINYVLRRHFINT